MQTEETRITKEDKQKLERQIKLQEEKVQLSIGKSRWDAAKELRRLRRLR